MKIQRVSLLIIHVFILLFSINANAGCSVHDHNCFHGSEPFNPTLDDLQTGTGDLTITTTWLGEGDINLHTGLPDDVNQEGFPVYGPFIPSNPSGDAVTTTPLGTEGNVVYHGQQTVQFANASAIANLTSDAQAAAAPGTTLTRQEQIIISGNVPSGNYEFALNNYDSRNDGMPVTADTVATAGEDGYFLDTAAYSAAQQASGHNPFANSAGASTEMAYTHSLDAGGVSAIENFEYRYANFDEHANGVYVIPDGVWNMHGVDPQQLYQFGTADMSQGFILNQGMQFDANPFNLERVNIYGYENWLYDNNSGIFLALGNQAGQEGMGDERLVRVATNGMELLVLGTALETPGVIQGAYGDTSRGHVNGFSGDSFQQAANLIGCTNCADSTILKASQDIATGSNTYGLSHEQQLSFLSLAARGYSSHAFYREQKDAYNTGNIKLGVSIAVATGGSGALSALQVGLITGGTNFALYGDFKQAIITGVTSGAFAGVDGLNLNGWADTGVKSTIGGVSSELSGGSFFDGFTLTAATSGSQNLYEGVVGYEIDAGPGGKAQPKSQTDLPVKGQNNFGISTRKPGSCFGCEGGKISVVGNHLPLGNAVAGFHDVMQVAVSNSPLGDLGRTIVNFPGMPIAGAITAAGFIAPGAPAIITSDNNEQ